MGKETQVETAVKTGLETSKAGTPVKLPKQGGAFAPQPGGASRLAPDTETVQQNSQWRSLMSSDVDCHMWSRGLRNDKWKTLVTEDGKTAVEAKMEELEAVARKHGLIGAEEQLTDEKRNALINKFYGDYKAGASLSKEEVAGALDICKVLGELAICVDTNLKEGVYVYNTPEFSPMDKEEWEAYQNNGSINNINRYSRVRGRTYAWMSKHPEYVQMVRAELASNRLVQNSEHKVTEDVVFAIITAESDGDTNSVSHAGATGLMQIMPEEGFERRSLLAPKTNIHYGITEIQQNLDRYNGDLRLALAGYNAGNGAVRKYGGVPPYRETQNYVRKIINNYLG